MIINSLCNSCNQPLNCSTGQRSNWKSGFSSSSIRSNRLHCPSARDAAEQRGNVWRPLEWSQCHCAGWCWSRFILSFLGSIGLCLMFISWIHESVAGLVFDENLCYRNFYRIYSRIFIKLDGTIIHHIQT